MDNNEHGTNLAEVGTDCISRRSVMDALTDENIIKHMDSVHDSELHRCKRAFERILSQMSPVQPKRGRWVLVCDNNGMHFICNKCGAWRYHQEQKFCGECGADMREVNHESN